MEESLQVLIESGRAFIKRGGVVKSLERVLNSQYVLNTNLTESLENLGEFWLGINEFYFQF